MKILFDKTKGFFYYLQMNCKKYIPHIICSLLLSPSVWAQKITRHEHGRVDFDVALEGQELLIIVNSPAQSLLGFEKKIETEQEKKTVAEIQNAWQTNFMSFINFPGIEKCEAKNVVWELKGSSAKHMEVKSEMTISCPSPIAGQLTIDPRKYSKHIEDARFDYLGPNGKSKRGNSHHGKKIIIDL
ncbi:MAG: hypothetical protein Fur0010_02890 [Bdellovibrio sp.]